MSTKRCLICNQYKRMDERDACCSACHEKELDLLMKVYAYIHCYGSDFVPQKLITENVEPVKNISVSLTFLRSWITRQWLERNDVDAVRVPQPIKESLDLGNFDMTPQLEHMLECLKDNKSPYDPSLLEGFKEKAEQDKYKKSSMAYWNQVRKG